MEDKRMKFTLTNDIKTIKNVVKAFTASGDNSKLSFWKINIETDPAGFVKITGQSGTSVLLSADIDEPGKVSMNVQDLVAALKGIEKTPTFVFADDKDNTIEVTEADGYSRKAGSWDKYEESYGPEAYVNVLSFTVSGEDVSRAFSEVIHCSSDDESRYAMCGVNINLSGLNPAGLNDGSIYAVATDGHRLAWSCICDVGGRFAGQIHRDNFTVRLIVARFLAETVSKTNNVTFSVFTKEDTILKRTKIWYAVDFGMFHIEDRKEQTGFPEWRRVIPAAERMTGEFTVTADFVKETDRIAKTVDKYRKVVITVSPDGAMAVRTEEAKQAIKAVKNIGTVEPFTFAMNIDYIRQAVKAAGKRAVRFMFAEPGRPFLTSAGDLTGSVIMPMNLNG